MRMEEILSLEPPMCPDCHCQDTQRRGHCGEYVFCTNCGVVHHIQDVADRGYSALQLSQMREKARPNVIEVCPHCSELVTESVNSSKCPECHLDMDQAELPSQEIAHLWKEGSAIRRVMSKGRCGPSSNLGTFLRKHCGPHCLNSKSCSQGGAELTKCRREFLKDLEREEEQEGTFNPFEEDDMGKKRKKKHKKKKKNKTIIVRSPSAHIECAEAGWFSEMIRYVTQNEDKECPRDSGSGSRTKKVS